MTHAAGSRLRVLVIEDQHDIAANIWDFLERRGHEVDHCADGVSGLARAMRGDVDVVVLDLGLPRMDGLDLCRRLRQAGHGVPILMLTARDTLEDKLRGFAEGADDYLVKPFAMRELEARIHAVRRHRQPSGGALAFAGLTYDPRTMIAERDARRIPLTRLQGSLLAALLQDAPRIVPHARLIDTGEAPACLRRGDGAAGDATRGLAGLAVLRTGVEAATTAGRGRGCVAGATAAFAPGRRH